MDPKTTKAMNPSTGRLLSNSISRMSHPFAMQKQNTYTQYNPILKQVGVLLPVAVAVCRMCGKKEAAIEIVEISNMRMGVEYSVSKSVET